MVMPQVCVTNVNCWKGTGAGGGRRGRAVSLGNRSLCLEKNAYLIGSVACNDELWVLFHIPQRKVIQTCW